MLALGRALVARPAAAAARRAVARPRAAGHRADHGLLRHLRDRTGLTVLLVEQNVAQRAVGRRPRRRDVARPGRRSPAPRTLAPTTTSATPTWGSDGPLRLPPGHRPRAAVRSTRVRAGAGADLAAARVVNFAQGAMAVATDVRRLRGDGATGSYWLGLSPRCRRRAAVGVAVERGVMRFAPPASPLSGVILAIGLVMVLQSALGIAFGPDYRPMRAPFDDSAIASTMSRSTGHRTDCYRAVVERHAHRPVVGPEDDPERRLQHHHEPDGHDDAGQRRAPATRTA